jgi:hypothetical protein
VNDYDTDEKTGVDGPTWMGRGVTTCTTNRVKKRLTKLITSRRDQNNKRRWISNSGECQKEPCQTGTDSS